MQPGNSDTSADRLRALHRPGAPLFLLNAWDVASARTIAASGAAALATTSGGIAAAYGYADGEQIPPSLMFEAISRMAAAVEVPLSADIESGYGLPPADLVARVLETGAVGVNIEDSDHQSDHVVVAAERQAERLAAIKDALRTLGADLVLNARIDVFLRKLGTESEQLEEALRRAKLYADAGADCLYPIMLVDEDAIRRLCVEAEAPVNIYLRPGAPSPARLAQLGVARISVGTALHRAAEGWLSRAAAALLEGDPTPLRGE